MNLISTEHGQSLQIFVAEEIRPPSGLYLPDVIRQISERYAFAIVPPPNYDTILKEGARYKEGRLMAPGRIISIKDLGFFNDGVLVAASNTDDSEFVLNELIAWAAQNFGIREPQTKLPRRFFSSVVVEFDIELSRALTLFDELRKGFSSAIEEYYDIDPEVNASRIALAADPTKLPPQTAFEISIERRLGRPYEENRYFSTAPLPTAAHLDLLESFERCLLGKSH